MASELFGHEPLGATPLDEEDLKGLLLPWVRTIQDRNLAEAVNISKARDKYLNKKFSYEELLDDFFIRQLHKDMFGDVWSWAGKLRTKEVNIGVGPNQVATSLRDLVLDARLWFQNLHDKEDFLACKFHHHLVAIHPFANGNGRISRFMGDLLMLASGRDEFPWGGSESGAPDAWRSSYINALATADKGNLQPIFRFAKGE